MMDIHTIKDSYCIKYYCLFFNWGGGRICKGQSAEGKGPICAAQEHKYSKKGL